MVRSCTLKGKPFSLEGPQLEPGEAAPNVTLARGLGDPVKISDTTGKVRILSVVPSLDTPVCALQTRRFHEEIADLPHVQVLTISCDLPTGMARFCAVEGIDPERIQVLSDHFDTSFGRAYGTLIPDLRVECRAVFVLDRDDTLRYVEYVPEVADHPNYDAILTCVRGLVGCPAT